MPSLRGACLTFALAALAAPPAASAAAAFNAGTGFAPAVTIDSAGVGYVTFVERVSSPSAANPDQIAFCKVAADATLCAQLTRFATPFGTSYPGQAAGEQDIFLRSDGQPSIFVNCFNCEGGDPETSQYDSGNGGGSFAPRAGTDRGLIGDVRTDGHGEYIPASNEFLGISSIGDFQRMPVAPVENGPKASLGPFAGGSNDMAAVSYVGTDIVAAIAGREAAGAVIRFTTCPTSANCNMTGSFSPATSDAARVGPGQFVTMATGPSGLFLVTANNVGIDTVKIEARKWDAVNKRFLAPTTVTETAVDGDRSVTELDVFQSASGQLHVAWYTRFGNAYSERAVRYATSGDAGVTWSDPVSLVVDPEVFHLRVAGNGPGVGRVTWAGSNNPASQKAVRVAALSPPLPKPGQGAPPPRATPRLTPSRPSVKITRDRRGRLVIVRTRGKLGLPPGTSAAQGCKGRVTVRIKRGKKTIAKSRPSVRSNCAFGKTFKLRGRNSRKGKISVVFTFPGNSALRAVTVKRTVKIRR